jgi:hypothetical protein
MTPKKVGVRFMSEKVRVRASTPTKIPVLIRWDDYSYSIAHPICLARNQVEENRFFGPIASLFLLLFLQSIYLISKSLPSVIRVPKGLRSFELPNWEPFFLLPVNATQCPANNQLRKPAESLYTRRREERDHSGEGGRPEACLYWERSEKP